MLICTYSTSLRPIGCQRPYGSRQSSSEERWRPTKSRPSSSTTTSISSTSFRIRCWSLRAKEGWRVVRRALTILERNEPILAGVDVTFRRDHDCAVLASTKTRAERTGNNEAVGLLFLRCMMFCLHDLSLRGSSRASRSPAPRRSARTHQRPDFASALTTYLRCPSSGSSPIKSDSKANTPLPNLGCGARRRLV